MLSAFSTCVFDSTTLINTSSIEDGEISHSFVHEQLLMSFKNRGMNLRPDLPSCETYFKSSLSIPMLTFVRVFEITVLFTR